MKFCNKCLLLILIIVAQALYSEAHASDDLASFSSLTEKQRYDKLGTLISGEFIPISLDECEPHVNTFLAISRDSSYRVRNRAVILLSRCISSPSAGRIGRRLIQLISSRDERPHVRSTAEQIIREMGLLTPELEKTISNFEEDEQYENGVVFFAKQLNSSVEEDRWNAVGRMFFYCERFRDWGDDDDEGLTEHCTDEAIDAKLVPVIKHLLTNFDNSLVKEVSQTLDGVKAMKLKEEVGAATIKTAIQRAQQQYSKLGESYDSIKLETTPQKAVLKARIEITANAVEALQAHLNDW